MGFIHDTDGCIDTWDGYEGIVCLWVALGRASALATFPGILLILQTENDPTPTVSVMRQ